MPRHPFILLFVGLIAVSCRYDPGLSITGHQLMTIDEHVGTDSAIYRFIQPYRDSLEVLMSEPIGYNHAYMAPFKPGSPLSNFVADLVLEAGKEFLLENNISGTPVISVINIRGLRASLPQGELALRHAFKLMPFENQLTAVKLTGEQMLQLFNHMAISNGDGISGATFTIGDQVAENIRILDEELTPEGFYWVITSDFVASGGDGYTIFQDSDSILIAPGKIRDIIVEGIRQIHARGELVKPDLSDRITVAIQDSY